MWFPPALLNCAAPWGKGGTYAVKQFKQWEAALAHGTFVPVYITAAGGQDKAAEMRKQREALRDGLLVSVRLL
jgi:hypothetical protein